MIHLIDATSVRLPRRTLPLLRRCLLAVAALIAAGTVMPAAMAQVSPTELLGSAQAPANPAKPSTASKVVVRPATEAKPLWTDLTPSQQQSLKPLAANWANIDEQRKRKWLALSKNYAALPAAEQAKLHSRMAEWASLSARQRTEARLNFAETKKLSPGEKNAKWQAYQALSPEEKQKLAAKATPNLAGATAAVKPVAPKKLAEVPVTRNGAKQSQLAHGGDAVDQHTLLPKMLPAGEKGESATVQKN